MRRFSRTARGLWVVCAGLLLLGSLSAAARSGGATGMVKETTERMLSALTQQRSEIERNPARIYELVNKILVPRFDFEEFTREAVGEYWPKASESQKRALIRGFREMLIRTYAKALLNYSGQEIRYLSENPGRSTTVVSARVREPGAKDPILIKYKLHKRGGSWKVYDVIIDGISLVLNYRGNFESQIGRQGIDETIRILND